MTKLSALLLAIATLAILACQQPMTPTTPITPAEPPPTPPLPDGTPIPEPAPPPAEPAAQTWPCDHYLGSWFIPSSYEEVVATRNTIKVIKLNLSGGVIVWRTPIATYSPAECVDAGTYHSLRAGIASMHSSDGRTGEIVVRDEIGGSRREMRKWER